MKTRIWILLALFGLCGCHSADELSKANEQIASLSGQLKAVQDELATIKSDLAEQKKKQARSSMDKLLQDLEKIAYLQPGDTGYSPVRFDLGVLTVQLSDVKPYANGSKVTLQFGNPLSSSINGLTATIDWGRVDEKSGADYSTAKTKEVTFNESLRSGAWTTVSVVLEGLPPTDLGFVRLSKIAHTGIKLNR